MSEGGLVNQGINAVGDLIKMAGETPKAKIAAGNLGDAAVTITAAINVCLLPLAAVNFAYSKAKTYFDEKFSDEIAAKTAHIPPDNLVEPKASIAGPALQGLAFAHEEPNLKDLFLGLLSTAMDSRKATSAHPAFVEIIKQMNAEEAGLISHILRSDVLPICQIHAIQTGSNVYKVLATNLMDIRESNDNNKRLDNPNLPAMVDNWIRLRLVAVAYDKTMSDISNYDWIEARPEIKRLRSQYQIAGVMIDAKRGILERTNFGMQFARAVGVLEY